MERNETQELVFDAPGEYLVPAPPEQQPAQSHSEAGAALDTAGPPQPEAAAVSAVSPAQEDTVLSKPKMQPAGLDGAADANGSTPGNQPVAAMAGAHSGSIQAAAADGDNFGS